MLKLEGLISCATGARAFGTFSHSEKVLFE